MFTADLTRVTPSSRTKSSPANPNAVVRLGQAVVSAAIGTCRFPFWVVAKLASRTGERVLLAIVILNVPFGLSKHFFFEQSIAEDGATGGLNISVATIAMALLYLGWLIRARSSALTDTRRQIRAVMPLLLFVLFETLSLLVARDVIRGLFQIALLLQACLLYLYISNRVKTQEGVLFVVRWLLIGLVLDAVFMLLQAGGMIGDLGGWGLKAQTLYVGTTRVSGTMSSPNVAGEYLAMIMAVALGVAFAHIRPAYRWLALAGLVLAEIPLVLTQSRGSWLSFCVAVMTIALLRGRSHWKAVLGVLAVVLLVAVSLVSIISDRLSSDDNGAAASRMPLNYEALAMIEDHPIMGVGANNYSLNMLSYAPGGPAGDWVYAVHNTYLMIWSESGIGALLAFLWFLIAILRQGLQSQKASRPFVSAIVLGCVAAIAGHMVHMCLEGSVAEGAPNDALWLISGLITAMYRSTIFLPPTGSRERVECAK